jgi:hypothetical protein
MSVYIHFIARGLDFVFPKNTGMKIAVRTRASVPAPISSKPSDASTTKGHPQDQNLNAMSLGLAVGIYS